MTRDNLKMKKKKEESWTDYPKYKNKNVFDRIADKFHGKEFLIAFCLVLGFYISIKF